MNSYSSSANLKIAIDSVNTHPSWHRRKGATHEIELVQTNAGFLDLPSGFGILEFHSSPILWDKLVLVWLLRAIRGHLVGTSNSMDNFGFWYGSEIVSSSQQVQIAHNAISSFKIKVEIQLAIIKGQSEYFFLSAHMSFQSFVQNLSL